MGTAYRNGQEVRDDGDLVGKGETQMQGGSQVSDLVPEWTIGP